MMLCSSPTLFPCIQRSRVSQSLGHWKYSVPTSFIVVSHLLGAPSSSGIWTYFQRVLLKKYANERNGVNILVGPIFDSDFDGVRDSTEKIRE